MRVLSLGVVVKTFKLILISTLSLFIFLPAQLSALEFNYHLYTKILEKNVYEEKTIKGMRVNVVDYKSLFKESQKSDSDYSKYLKQLSLFNPDTLTTKADKIAFWVNAYNIGAIKMILDHYPVDSIRSMKINFLKNPWDKKILNINGRLYRLGEIEHDILLGKYKEKQAHFGMVCASVSCPDISKEVYKGKTLKTQLEKQAKELFKNSAKGLYIERNRNKVFVSKIFKFDSKNFSQGVNDIIPFILPFIENKKDKEYLEQKKYKLTFFDYDWDLNSLTNVKR